MKLRCWAMGVASLGLLAGVAAATAADTDETFQGDPVAAYFKSQVDAAGGLAPAQQGAMQRSEVLAEKCAVCHGADGAQSVPMKKVVVPNIAGQQPLYLFKQLWNLRSGARNHPVMKVMAEGLADEDLLALALRFSALPLPPWSGDKPEASPDRGAAIYRELCIHCHGEDGMGNAGIPRLKGQNPIYVKNTLTGFRDGGPFRTHAGMASITAKLQDDDIASIAAFVVDFSR